MKCFTSEINHQFIKSVFFVNLDKFFTVLVFSRSSLCFIEIVYFEPQLLDGLAVQSINFIIICGLQLIN